MQRDNEDANVVAGLSTDPAIADRASRLRDAVRAGGGNKVVADRAGMPVSTLNRYVAGRDMKASALVALSRATGVRLDWLATGEGPMAAGTPDPEASSGNQVQPPYFLRGSYSPGAQSRSAQEGASDIGIAWRVNPDRLAQAYEMALNGFAVAPGRQPDAKRLMQVTLIIYDDLTEAEQAAKSDPKAL